MRAPARNSGSKILRALTGCVAGVLACVCFLLPVYAGPLEDSTTDPRVAELITTGVRVRPLAELPRSANIITADDIALQPSTNIVDLLAREANLNLRSTLGNAKFSGVDIRGQGDTYRSNVQVLVDGISLNAADLSGADYSSVPLDQIDRIEVIRGANSVRYGSGAVGGVVNIITKDAQPGSRMNAEVRGGSYSTVETGVGGAWAGEQLSLSGNASYHDSDGYRENSGLETKDAALQAGYRATDWFRINLRGELHKDEYGLPGPVGAGEDPRSSSTPLDGGATDDRRARLDLNFGTDTTGLLRLTGSLRDRENEYNLAGVEVPEPDLIQQDDTRLELQYDKSFGWLGLEHQFSAGVDLLQTDYSRDEFALSGLPSGTKAGDIRETAWFAAVDFALTEQLTMAVGYRDDEFRIDGTTTNFAYAVDCDPALKRPEPGFEFLGPVCPEDAPLFPQLNEVQGEVANNKWRNSAAELGFIYSLSDDTNLFLSWAQSFRNPNVDELIVADDDLGPQTGEHLDVGFRRRFGQFLEWNLALFYNRTENEILFALDEDLSEVNRNADEPTRRTGGETDVRWYVLPSLTLTANVGYTNAQFVESGSAIPLVPKWTGAIGVQWQPAPDWVWVITDNYVGERYDGSDYSNEGPRLDDYNVVDTRVTWERSGLQVYGGINNVFDKLYATTAYGGQFYPMPDRNFYAGIAYRMNN